MTGSNQMIFVSSHWPKLLKLYREGNPGKLDTTVTIPELTAEND